MEHDKQLYWITAYGGCLRSLWKDLGYMFQSILKSLRYEFVIQFVGERMFKIGEHLRNCKMVECVALDFCPQRCRTRQISKISCVSQTETVVMLIGSLMWVYCQKISNYCRPDLMYWLSDLCHQWLLFMYGILLQHLFLCYSSCIQSVMAFLYCWCSDVNIFC